MSTTEVEHKKRRVASDFEPFWPFRPIIHINTVTNILKYNLFQKNAFKYILKQIVG